MSVPLRGPAAGIGINLIGYLSGNLGQGVSARHYARLFRERGFDVCLVEVPVSGRRANHDTSLATEWWPLDLVPPHAVNLFVMGPFETAHHRNANPALAASGKINAILPFWELPQLPNAWPEYLAAMDLVVAPGDYIKYALLADFDAAPVRIVRHPLYLPDSVRVDRARFGIPDGTVAFACSFEMASDINRKNPFAAIEAFDAAFGAGTRQGPDTAGRAVDALLIIKINNSHAEAGFSPHLERLHDYTRRNPRIRLLDAVLPYSDVLSLFASCDVFVSLHRAEGLGLCLMEAMRLGKPVITTAWSGSMDFTSEQNACLVGYELVRVQNSTQSAYSAANLGGDARWAEASRDEAADWMRRLAHDPALRTRIGARAASDMQAFQDAIDVGELAAALERIAAERGIALRRERHGSPLLAD